MNQVLAEAYLDYLEPLIGVEQDEPYRDLLELMFETPYAWHVPNDDNRMADGLEVRAEWFDKTGQAEDMGPCSFLEVVIGLSRRMEWYTGESAEGWAWQLLVNLGLDRFRGPLSRRRRSQAEDIMEAVIWRNYGSDGSGGFFPLTHPEEDQRRIELWFQMSAYIHEIHPEY